MRGWPFFMVSCRMSGDHLQPTATRGRLIATLFSQGRCSGLPALIPHRRSERRRLDRQFMALPASQPALLQRKGCDMFIFPRGLLLLACLVAVPCTHANEEPVMPTSETPILPPVAPKHPHTLKKHGDVRIDNYY